MALNASGPISLGGSTAGQSIAVELGLSATGQISLNDSAVRGLAGVPSGTITMPTNFWGKSNTYLDPTAIPLGMYGPSTYSLRVGRFNWNTGTYTDITTVSNWYTMGNGSQNPSCVLDPSGNLYMCAGGTSNPGPSWRTFAYLPKGSSSVTTVYYDPGYYPDFGGYMSAIAWNTSYGACTFNVAPHSAEPGTSDSYWGVFYGTFATTNATSTMGWQGGWPTGLTQLRSIDTSGKPTLSGSILGVSRVAPSNAGNPAKFFIGSGTSFPTATGSFLNSGSSTPMMAAPTGTSSGVGTTGGFCYAYPSGTDISSIGTIGSGFWTGVAPLANGAFIGFTGSFKRNIGDTRVNAFSNASTSPTWTTDLSGIFANYLIAYIIGAGDTCYVLAGTGASGGSWVLFRLVFNLSTGSYTSSSYSLGVGYSTNCYSSNYDVS